MAGLGSTTNQTHVTPNRQTVVRFDFAEPTALEPVTGIYRQGHEIARGEDPDLGLSENVDLAASGAWTIKALQDEQHYVHERDDNQSAVIVAPQWNLVNAFQTRYVFRAPTDLQGVTVGPNVSNSGDPFLQKTVPAGQTWNRSHAADIAAYGQPTFKTFNVPVDRVAITTATYQADQGYYFRVKVPGTDMHSPDVLCVLYFGGPATPYGHGQYGLILQGDGQAELHERIANEPGGTMNWAFRARFRYSEPHRVCNHLHTFRVFPHRKPDGGGYIEFRMGVSGAAPTLSLVNSYHSGPARPLTYLFEVLAPPAGTTRPNVTGQGVARVDQRRDQRPMWQLSLLRYFATATLVDLAFAVPFYVTGRNDLVLVWRADIPSGTSVVGKLFDAVTHDELELVEDGTAASPPLPYRTYRVARNQSHYHVKFTLSSNTARTLTPVLWSYRVQRESWIEELDDGEFSPSILRQVSISGPEQDPSHETAQVEIEDPTNALTTLRARASIRTRIQTRYDPADATKHSVLFDGYAQRINALKKGTTSRRGFGGAGEVVLYPSAEWRNFHATFMGMWQRLHEALAFARVPLALDPNAEPAADGTQPPYKVTDVVRSMLQWAGFPEDQIDVPDAPIRFFPVPGNDEALIIEPTVNVGEFVTKALKDYLGWFLIWDGNAGTRGKWRARGPSIAPYTNLIHFVKSPTGAGKLSMRPESYGTAGWWGNAPVTVPIRKGTFSTYVKPPEANAVLVTGTGQLLPNKGGQFRLSQWAVNKYSYNFYTDEDGNTVQTADPDHPDYLGRFVPLIVIDPTLQTQEAVDWTTRRYYDFTAHAIKMTEPFQAPLPLITVAGDTHQTKPRPPRYYDPCTIDGAQFLIRNCNPSYVHDGIQMATFECESPRL